jgi:hypothetical protein
MPVNTIAAPLYSRTLYVHTDGQVTDGNPEYVWIYGELDQWARLLLEEAGFEYCDTFETPYYRLPDTDPTPYAASRAVRLLNSFDYRVILDAPEPRR